MTEHAVESSAEIVLDLNEKKPIRVLHVDDELGLLKVAKQCLEMNGHFQVDTASSAEEAMERIKKELYDAIVCDYLMPGKDGLELLKDLRANGNSVPFIMFTGKGREEVAVKAWNLGADHYVNKNGDPETVYYELAHCLRSAVNKHTAEVQARETTQKLQAIYQNALEGIGYVSPEENFVYVNRAFADILGCQEDRLVGMNLCRFVDEEGWAKIKSETKRRRQGEASRYEVVFYRTDGATRNVMVSGSPLFGSDGSFAGTVGIVLDITESKKAEEALKSSERKYREFADSLPEIAFEVDEKGNVTFFNRRAFEILGYSQEDFRSLSIFQFLIPEDRVRVKENIQKILKGEKSRGNEYTLLRKDGSTFPVIAFTNRIVREDGKGGVRGVIINISQQKNTEEKLRESEEKFRNLAEQSPNMIFINQKGRVVYANKEAEDVMGYKKEEFYSPDFNFMDLVVQESKELVKSAFSKHMKDEDVAPYEYRLVTREGRIIDAILTTKLITYEGEPAILGTVIDITERKKSERELFDKQMKLQNIFAASPDAIAVVDLNGNLIDCNQAALNLYGCSSKDDLIGKSAFDLIAKKDQPRAIEKMKETIEQGLVKDVLYTLVTKDGREYPAELSSSVVKDSSGNPVAFVAIIRDITERKKKEEALRESEEKYKDLFESAMDVILTLDLKGSVTAVNSSISRFGYKKEDLVGKSILDFVSKEYWPTVMRDSSRVTQGEPARNETEIVVPTGKILVEYNARAIVKESNVTGVQINLRDVTERKKVEEAVRSSEAKLRAILASSPEAISVSDLNAKLIDCNEAFLKLHGYLSKEELIGTSWFDVIAPANRFKIQDTMGKLLEHGYIKNMEFALLKKGGQEFVGELSASLVLDSSGKPTSIVVVARDITERKEMEEKLRESEGRFGDLFENIQDPVGIFVGREGSLIDYNKAFKRSSGYTDEELKGKAFLDFVHPDDHAMVLEKYQTKYSEEEFPLVYEIRGMNKKGESIPLELSVSTYKQKGRVIGIEVIHRDITERKKAEEERKRYEEKLSALNTHSRKLNTAESMEEVYRLTIDAVEKTLGFETAFFMVVDKDMLCVVDHRGYPESFSIGLPLNGTKRGVSVKVVKTGRSVNVPDAEKEDAWVEFMPGIRSGLDVPVKIGSKVLGVIGVDSKELNAFNEKDQELLEILASHAATAMSNLEYSKNLEAYAREILESQQRFERLFIGNPEAAVYLGPDFRILGVNPRFEELFGYSLAEAKGRHINEVVVPSGKMEEAEILDRKAIEGYVYHDTVRRRKDGSLVPVAISAAPIIVDGRPAGYVGMYKDISELKNAERKLEIMNEKLRVVGGLTRHDVRNKLTAITGNTYLARKELAGNSKILKYLKEMETAVQQTVRIFDFAKAYEMLGAQELVYVDVGKTVDEAVSLFSDLKGVEVTNDCHGLSVLADSLLRQLFYNLIDNSLKYGQKTTRIRAHYEETSQDELRLVYEDDGVGILAAEKPKLFKEGYSTGGSTGYGLCLIKKMMETYGWTIQETGTPGKGAQFTITIPEINQDGKENYQLH